LKDNYRQEKHYYSRIAYCFMAEIQILVQVG